MCNTIGDRLGNGFVLGPVTGKCNCAGQCSPLQAKDCFPPAPEGSDGDFMSKIGSLAFLLALIGCSPNRIESVDDVRKCVDDLHQNLMDLTDELGKKAEELQKEGFVDEI